MHGSDLEESSDHVSEYAALSEVHSSVYWKTILNMSFPSFCNGTPPGCLCPMACHGSPKLWAPTWTPGMSCAPRSPPASAGPASWAGLP